MNNRVYAFNLLAKEREAIRIREWLRIWRFFLLTVFAMFDRPLLARSNLLPSSERDCKIDGTDPTSHDVFYR
jgi:hypothetical protein